MRPKPIFRKVHKSKGNQDMRSWADILQKGDVYVIRGDNRVARFGGQVVIALGVVLDMASRWIMLVLVVVGGRVVVVVEGVPRRHRLSIAPLPTVTIGQTVIGIPFLAVVIVSKLKGGSGRANVERHAV